MVTGPTRNDLSEVVEVFLGDGEVTAIELGDTWCFPDLDLIRLQFRSHSHCSVCCSCLHITVVVAVVSGLEHTLFVLSRILASNQCQLAYKKMGRVSVSA